MILLSQRRSVKARCLSRKISSFVWRFDDIVTRAEGMRSKLAGSRAVTPNAMSLLPRNHCVEGRTDGRRFCPGSVGLRLGAFQQPLLAAYLGKRLFQVCFIAWRVAKRTIKD
jgi:hypothetical protein